MKRVTVKGGQPTDEDNGRERSKDGWNQYQQNGFKVVRWGWQGGEGETGKAGLTLQ